MANSNGIIIDIGDQSDFDGNLCLPLYKAACGKACYDYVYIHNYPAYLSTFTTNGITSHEYKGIKCGLFEFMYEKYKLTLAEYMTFQEIKIAFLDAILHNTDAEISEYMNILLNTISNYYNDMTCYYSSLHIFKTLHKLLSIYIVNKIWTTAHSYGTFKPTVYVCDGGINEQMAFAPNHRLILMIDELFVYRKSLDELIFQEAKNLEEVLNIYKKKNCYIAMNGPASFYTNGLFKDLNIKGVYVMTGVEIGEMPFTLYLKDVTYRTPYSTMNNFLAPRATSMFLRDMSKMPIHVATNNEVNKNLVCSFEDIWSVFGTLFTDNREVFKLFNAYYIYPSSKVKAKIKPYDVLSARHLVVDMLETRKNNILRCFKINSTDINEHCLYFDEEYGIAIIAPVNTSPSDIDAFIKNNNDTVEGWSNLNNIIRNVKWQCIPLCSLSKYNKKDLFKIS